MLFIIENALVDIVREDLYTSVLTLRSPDRNALKNLRRYTGANIVRVPDQFYPWVLHIPQDNLHLDIRSSDLSNVEVVSALTPPPVAYYYDFCVQNDEGELEGDYGYCWPNEITSVTESLMYCEIPAFTDPIFLPLFRIPAELLTKSN